MGLVFAFEQIGGAVIMGASYEKQKKSKTGKLDIAGRWTAWPHVVIHSKEYRKLGFAARALLFDIAAQYNASNNGKLVCCMKYLKPLGWNSNDTITRALRELLTSGLLIQTRQGMRPPFSQAAWFAIGWFGLDVQSGLDIEPRLYRKCKLTPLDATSPIIGKTQTKTTPKNGEAAQETKPIAGALEGKNEQVAKPINGDYIDLPSTHPIIHEHYLTEEIRYDH